MPTRILVFVVDGAAGCPSGAPPVVQDNVTVYRVGSAHADRITQQLSPVPMPPATLLSVVAPAATTTARPSGRPKLSAREREVLDHIAGGLTHGQAARRMNVTKATVDTYVERLRRKLGAGNKADLTRVAMSLGPGDAAG